MLPRPDHSAKAILALAVPPDRIKETMAQHRTYQITRCSFLKPSGFTYLTPSKNLDRTESLNELEYILFSRLSNIQLHQCTFNVQFFHTNVQFFRSNVQFFTPN